MPMLGVLHNPPRRFKGNSPVLSLKEFAKKYDIPLHYKIAADSGERTTYVYEMDVRGHEWELHHLRDYVVSSVSGPVRWMRPVDDRSEEIRQRGGTYGNPPPRGRGLNTLRREAQAATKWRGHKMSWSAPWHGERKSTQRGTCTVCGMDVDVNTRPEANGIDIGGEAVALNCPGEMVRENSLSEGVTKEVATAARHGAIFHYGNCRRNNVGPRGGVTTRIERWRVSGKCQTWARQPEKFRLPIKYGLYNSSAITEQNGADFHSEDDCPATAYAENPRVRDIGNVVNDYESAVAFLGDRSMRKLALNTTVVNRGDSVAVRLYGTDVVTYHSDGSVTLRSGGYRTITTLRRIKQLLPPGMTLKAWKLYDAREPGSKGIPFEDGMRIGVR